MTQVSLEIRGYKFNLPQENVIASHAVQAAVRDEGSRRKVFSNLFFATVSNGYNSAYYTAHTLVKTAKKFPTEGKKEAKKFLIEEGTKACNTAVYTASTLFLMIASLYDSKWALSHFEVTDGSGGGGPLPPRNPPPRNPPPRNPAPRNQVPPLDQDQDLDQLLIDPEYQLQVLTGAFGQLEDDPYTTGLLQAFGVGLDVESLPQIKLLLARIVFVQDWEADPNLQHVIPVIQDQLAIVKQDSTIIQEKAEKADVDETLRQANEHESANAAALREEQRREYQAGLEAERKKELEAEEKESQEADLVQKKTELETMLGPINERLRAFDGIKEDLQTNWQQVQRQTKGAAALEPAEMYTFVTTRLRAVDLEEEIDLTEASVAPLAFNLKETCPKADESFFDALTETQLQIEAVAEELNSIIQYAGLMKLVQGFKENPTDEEKDAFGQQVIDLVKDA